MVRIGMYEYDEDAKLGSGSEGEVYKGINTEVCHQEYNNSTALRGVTDWRGHSCEGGLSM